MKIRFYHGRVSEKTTLFKTEFSEMKTTGIFYKKGFFNFFQSLLTHNPCSSMPFSSGAESVGKNDSFFAPGFFGLSGDW